MSAHTVKERIWGVIFFVFTFCVSGWLIPYFGHKIDFDSNWIAFQIVFLLGSAVIFTFSIAAIFELFFGEDDETT
jgi:putative Mn2+ efflux pump MntP